VLFGGYGANNDTDWLEFGFGYSNEPNDTFYWTTSSSSSSSTAVFRDLSAWYHILVSYNGSNIVAYVNNTTILTSSKTGNLGVNGAWLHTLGRSPNSGIRYFDGYLADVFFIDGQALDPTSFTEVSATTGQLIPKAYTDVLPGPVTLVPSIAEGALIIKANDATITGSVTAAGFVKVHSSSDGINWTYREQILSGALSFSAKYIAIGGGSTNSRTFNPSTGGSYTWAEYSAGTQFDTTSNITLNVTGLSYTANSTVTAPFGTNGFWLKFSDNSAATATTLGKDYSGNSNNWTPNNLSVTAGAGNDSLVDTPTSYGTDTGAGGEVRGNYATLNPLAKGGDIQAPTNGNLQVTSSGSGYGLILGTIGMSSGKWYWEVTTTSANCATGIATNQANLASYGGADAYSWVWASYSGGSNKRNNNIGSSYGSILTNGDVVGVAFDADNGTLTFYKNNVSQGAAYTGLATGTYLPVLGDETTAANIDLTANFGQRPFAYTAPSGFKALCDTNLPAPVVAKPSTVMDVKLYTGNGSTQTISGLGFSPDLVWIKGRSTSYSHMLFDTIRGATNYLYSNNTNAEASDNQTLTAFTSDGFSLGNNVVPNQSSATHVAWTWDAGSSTVTNTQGSITSQVRTNGYLSIVTYTGTGANATVGHGLGVAPQMIIVKSRNSVTNWGVGHTSIGWANALRLNTTDASSAQATFWNSTAPTSTVFSIGTGPSTNNNGDGIVAYCFAPVAGYSSAFSFTGTGTDPGPFVYLGFRPKLIIVKRTDNGNAASHWRLIDMTINPYNVADTLLYANSSAAELTEIYGEYDALSNGFRVMTDDSNQNASGSPYIGFAWAENPFQYARAR
jgi:hypothetical protein